MMEWNNYVFFVIIWVCYLETVLTAQQTSSPSTAPEIAPPTTRSTTRMPSSASTSEGGICGNDGYIESISNYYRYVWWIHSYSNTTWYNASFWGGHVQIPWKDYLADVCEDQTWGYNLALSERHKDISNIGEDIMTVDAIIRNRTDGQVWMDAKVEMKTCNGDLLYRFPWADNNDYNSYIWNTYICLERKYKDLTCNSLDNVYNTGTMNNSMLSLGAWQYGMQPGWFDAFRNGKQYVIPSFEDAYEVFDKCIDMRNGYGFFLKDKMPETIGSVPKRLVLCEVWNYRYYDYMYDENYHFSDNCHYVYARECSGKIQFDFSYFQHWGYLSLCLVYYNNVKVLPEIGHLIGDGDRYIPYLQFRCSFEMVGSYIVKWYINGVLLMETGPSSVSDDLVFRGEELINLRLGYEVKCGVIAMEPTASNETFSDDFYAGWKIADTSIRLSKNGHAFVDIEQTVPLVCSYMGKVQEYCEEILSLVDPAHNDSVCSAGIRVLNAEDTGKSYHKVKSLQMGEKWNQNIKYRFILTTIDHDYDDKLYFELQLLISKTSGKTPRAEVGNLELINTVEVVVTQSDKHRNKRCYSHVDPHMRSADGRYYEQQREGDHMLYRNLVFQTEQSKSLYNPKTRIGRNTPILYTTHVGSEDSLDVPLTSNQWFPENRLDTTYYSPCRNQRVIALLQKELAKPPMLSSLIQESTKYCSDNYKGGPVCACGIAVRSGADVFMIDRCGSFTYLDFLQCGDGGILDVERIHDYHYKVITPIGTIVDIALHAWSRTMNIDIYLSAKDFNNTDGLCGFFDGVSSNDFRHRDGTTSSGNSDYAFSNSWRLSDEENLFKNGSRVLENWDESNGGSFGQSCSRSNSITKNKCKFERRKKRADTIGVEVETHHVDNMSNQKLIREERSAGSEITEEEARALCNRSIYEAPAVREFPDKLAEEDPEEVITQCVYDIVQGNDTVWAVAHTDALNNIATAVLDLSPVYSASNPESIKSFRSQTCLNNCSGNGACLDTGLCECEGIFRGPDCGIDLRIPPIIFDIQGGDVCNPAEGEDCICFVLRTNNIFEGFTYEISTFTVYFNGARAQVGKSTHTGEYEDIFTGVCCVPEQRRKRDIGDPDASILLHGLTLSNDGNNYGASRNVFVYDSTCLNLILSDMDELVSIELKGGYCYIGNICIKKGSDLQTQDVCYECNPDETPHGWAKVSCKDDTDIGLTTATLGGIIAGSVLAGIIITVAIVYMRCFKGLKKRRAVDEVQSSRTYLTPAQERTV